MYFLVRCEGVLRRRNIFNQFEATSRKHRPKFTVGASSAASSLWLSGVPLWRG
jgi:hypothetical protein